MRRVRQSPPPAQPKEESNGGKCYVDCEYCLSLPRKSDALLRTYIKQLLEAHPSPELNVVWQGSEPTSLGLDFFSRAVDYMEELRKPGQQIRHTMRTSGALLNDKWCVFLKKHRVFVGLKLNGPRTMHGACGLAGGFDDAVRSWDLLRSHGVEFNIVCTIHAANVDHPVELYRFFRGQLKDEPIDFIPVDDRSIGAAQLGRFLIAIFEEWVRRDVGTVFVRNFDVALGSWLGKEISCNFSPTSGNAMAVKHNADLYAGDEGAQPDSIPEPPEPAFLEWEWRTGPVHYDLSAGYKMFYQKIHPAMKAMAGLIRQGRRAGEVMRSYAAGGAGVARDTPCPCRSGRKFKHCHGTFETGQEIRPLPAWEGRLPRWLTKCIARFSYSIVTGHLPSENRRYHG